MKNLVDELHLGNTRANRDRIAAWVGVDTERFSQVMRIYLTGGRREAQLAAGVLFCCHESHPELLVPWLSRVIKRIDDEDAHPAVRRFAVRAMMDLDIPRSLQGRVLDLCFRYLSDPSEPIAIRVFSMGTIARIAADEPFLQRELRQVIDELLPYASGAFVAHARRVTRRFERSDRASRRKRRITLDNPD